MKVQFLTLLLVLSLTSPAWARLGETEDQLVARYGKEVGKGSGGITNKAAPDSLQFSKGGYFIVVWLLNGVSAEEYITKDDFTRGGKNDPLTKKEVETLVDANTQGHTWREITPNAKWIRDDGATAARGTNVFDIKSKELIDANAVADKPAPSSLKGF